MTVLEDTGDPLGLRTATISRRQSRGAVFRTIAVVVLVLAAFHYSLRSVVRSLGADSPLAYLGLVPLVALIFAIALARPRRDELDVHDRYLDLIVGIPALFVPIVAMVVLPTRMSTFFWLWRIDLLLLPMFVVGAVALLFGSRTLLRVKPAIAFLLLAWPVPFRLVIARWLEPFAELSSAAVGLVVKVIPVAAQSPTQPERFSITGPEGSFDLIVASQCSGANSLIGFLLLATPTVWMASGSRQRKWVWLAAGAVLIWALNVVRILAIFTVGKFWGEEFAVDAFHPYVGLVTFGVGTALMVWLLPRFGLYFGGGSRVPLGPSLARAVPRWRAALVTVGVAAVVMGLLNAGLVAVNPVASALGTARLVPFETAAARVEAMSARRVDHFDWATRYFGERSDWTRYEISGISDARLGSEIPVTADVVTTDDASTFDDFGVDACYQFHGFAVENRREVELGKGQFATVMSWQDPRSPIRWTSLYWYWPVNLRGETRYQRIVLMINSTAPGKVWAPPLRDNVLAQLGLKVTETLDAGARRQRATELSARDDELRRFLVALGRELVARSSPEWTA
jgi:exosortase/archaeosortase family protein